MKHSIQHNRKLRSHLSRLIKIPRDCVLSDCYPISSDLLLGRKKFLYANSTCGLKHPEEYCELGYRPRENIAAFPIETLYFPYKIERVLSTRCSICNSLRDFNHKIEKIVMDSPTEVDLRGREIIKKWWQSESGVENVFIRFDLEAVFTMSVLIMRFKTFPPAAMLIEKSDNFGLTWTTLAYYALNCAESYPHVPTYNTKDLKKPFCTSKYFGFGKNIFIP